MPGWWTSGWVLGAMTSCQILRHSRAPRVNYPELLISQEEFIPRFLRAAELQMGSCPALRKDMNLTCQRHLHRGQLNGGDIRGTDGTLSHSHTTVTVLARVANVCYLMSGYQLWYCRDGPKQHEKLKQVCSEAELQRVAPPELGRQ